MPATSDLRLITRARAQPARTAVVAAEGTFTYDDLLDASARVAASLLNGAADLREARVAFIAPPGWHYVSAQWGIWRAGGIAVPLALSHPPAELEYVIQDAGAAVVLAHPELADRVQPIGEREGRRFLTTEEALQAEPAPLPTVEEERRAMMIYTSGTTGRPKGAMLTHASLLAAVDVTLAGRPVADDDVYLFPFPLCHVAGYNVLAHHRRG
ncbi:MAG TPA: AMP-binding protein, partial [Chloroflexota bacterium]|nr:AMP-binding protein [Chloroflexota bacterium]